MATNLGGAGDVHDQQVTVTDVLVEPEPGFGVPGLAGRPEQAKPGEIIRREPLPTPPLLFSDLTAVGDVPKTVSEWFSISSQG